MRLAILLGAAITLLTIHTPAGDPATQTQLAGEVVETMNAGAYTYVLVQQGNQKSWAAAPRFEVAVGDKVKINHGSVMREFRSETLKRTFDWVLFASAVEVNGQGPDTDLPALPPGHPPLPGATADAPAHTLKSPSIYVKKGSVEKVPGGYTVAEIYAQKKKLAGKSIQVRSVVVKFNAEIMGRNWVHLRDGTGTDGSNDLTITTKDTVKPGDTVIAAGKLATDKDFGAGYKYGVIVEDAVLKKQNSENHAP